MYIERLCIHSLSSTTTPAHPPKQTDSKNEFKTKTETYTSTTTKQHSTKPMPPIMYANYEFDRTKIEEVVPGQAENG